MGHCNGDISSKIGHVVTLVPRRVEHKPCLAIGESRLPSRNSIRFRFANRPFFETSHNGV